jgi:long-subunit fatty acid transport protein
MREGRGRLLCPVRFVTEVTLASDRRSFCLAPLALGLSVLAGPVLAQDGPSRDELDFQGRSNILVGSGARALGMAGAFLARADDATAASWNPAGLSYLRLPELSLVGKWDDFGVETSDPGGTLVVDDNRRGSTPDFLALTYPVDFGGVTGAAQVSFQRVISFNGSRDILRNENPITIESEGGFDVLAFGTGLRVSRKWRLGATLNYWFNGYQQVFERGGDQPTVLRTEFDFSGWNVNLGVLFSPIENLNLGLVGKTSFTGDVQQALSREPGSDGRPGNRFDGTIPGYPSITIDFPGALGFGASWRPSSPWTLSADYTRSFWAGGQIYNFFTLPFAGPPPPVEGGRNFWPELPYPTLTDPEQWDSAQIRVGAEFVAGAGGKIGIPLRVGYFNDRQYFRAEDGRPPDFNGVTAGTGVILGSVLFDVAYTFEHGSYLDVDESGNRITVRAQQVVFSLIYRHDRRP